MRENTFPNLTKLWYCEKAFALLDESHALCPEMFPNLEDLHFGYSVSNKALAQLPRFEHLTSLSMLEITPRNAKFLNEDMFSRLTTLGVKVSEGVDWGCVHQKFQKLTSITIHEYSHGEKDTRFFERFDHLESFTDERFDGLYHEKTALRLLKLNCKSLKRVNFCSLFPLEELHTAGVVSPNLTTIACCLLSGSLKFLQKIAPNCEHFGGRACYLDDFRQSLAAGVDLTYIELYACVVKAELYAKNVVEVLSGFKN